MTVSALSMLASQASTWGTSMRALILILVTCTGTVVFDARLFAQDREDQQNVSIAAATAIQSILKDRDVSASRTILDTRTLASDAIERALAVATGWSRGNRADVLHCVPPICRLVDADALVSIQGPSFLKDGTAFIFVEFWINASEARGAAMTSYRVELSRSNTCKGSCVRGWSVDRLVPIAVS
jgi:hypothetical protein